MTILCQNKSEIHEHFWPIRLAGLIEAKLRTPLRPSAGELAQPAEFGPRLWANLGKSWHLVPIADS
jgi:hypothetical protein